VSLRARLLVGLTALVLVAVTSSGWLLFSVTRLKLEGAREAQMLAIGELVAERLRAALEGAPPPSELEVRARLDRAVGALVARRVARGVVIVDRAGAVLARVEEGGEADAPSPATDVGLRAVLGGGPAVVSRRDGAAFVYAPLVGPEGVRGAIRLRARGDDDVARALASARGALVAVTAFDALLVLLFGALFIRRVVGPIEELAQAARRVAVGDGGAKLVAPGRGARRDDEIGRLQAALETMTASLAEQREFLVQQEKLATVGRLSAGVAHEVGNPLAAILGYVDLLLAEEPPPAPGAPADEDGSSRRAILERIRKETDRIRGIITDLLDYSRPRDLAPQPLALGEVVEAALALCRPQARFRRVIVEDRVPRDLPLARGSTRVLQIVLNLLLNAADAMKGEGTITVEGKLLDGDAGLALTVRDTGPGVPEGDRDRIFDPFFTTKEPGQGTGLGLAVSRAIAQASGGDLLLARATDGTGATFVLRLARWRDDAAPAKFTPAPGR
jgi:signal transduction histidine kinase